MVEAHKSRDPHFCACWLDNSKTPILPLIQYLTLCWNYGGRLECLFWDIKETLLCWIVCKMTAVWHYEDVWDVWIEKGRWINGQGLMSQPRACDRFLNCMMKNVDFTHFCNVYYCFLYKYSYMCVAGGVGILKTTVKIRLWWLTISPVKDNLMWHFCHTILLVIGLNLIRGVQQNLHAAFPPLGKLRSL